MTTKKTLAHLLSQISISNGDVRYMSPDVKEEIISKTPACNGPLRERLYWLQNNLLDYPECDTCSGKLSSKNFRPNFKNGRYTTTCSVKCAKRNNTFSEKVKSTNRQKYGTDHFLSSVHAREKIEKTNIEKYGQKVAVPWNSEKIKQTMIQRYGAEHMMQTASRQLEFKREIIQNNILSGKTQSSITACEVQRNVKCLNADKALDVNRDILENVELEWLHNLCGESYSSPIVDGCINVCPHCKVGTSILELSLRTFIQEIIPEEDMLFNVKGIIPGSNELDIFIPSRNIAIEFNGIYWHSTIKNANKYKHVSKTEACQKLGIRLIHIWEDHFLQKPEIIKSMLKNYFGLSQKIYARKCEIVEISSKEAITFMNANHLQGGIISKVNLALKHGDDIVSVMTLGRKRFGRNEENSWEIYRFASKVHTQIQGACSKLFNYFIKKYNPTSVISFSDLSLGGGNVYEQIGMKYEGVTPPSYFWANILSPTRMSRFKSQKHKLKLLLGDKFSADLTEEQNMKQAGWFKLWDCGNKKFTYYSR